MEATYYFNSYDVGEAWGTNPENMVDGDEDVYASETTPSTVQLNDGNTCDGTDLGTISKVELRLKHYLVYAPFLSLRSLLRPIFSGGDGDDHTISASSSEAWSDWVDITSDTNAPESWSWANVQSLDVDCEDNQYMTGSATLYVSKIEVKVTYTTVIKSYKLGERHIRFGIK